MNLKELKQEARERLLKISPPESKIIAEAVADWNDTLIDKVVDAVEESVVPKLRTGFSLDDDEQNYKWMGRNEARDAVLEAFRNFRGV